MGAYKFIFKANDMIKASLQMYIQLYIVYTI